MRILKHLSILLLLLITFLVSGTVSAKVASGDQNVSLVVYQADGVVNWLTHQGKSACSTTGPPGSSVVAKRGVKSLRPVGSVLESVNDVLTNPKLLTGKTPAQIQAAIGKTPGWKVETLGKGSKKGQGWVFREYNGTGQPTGQSLRWHPGGGHHGPAPYWRVTSNVVGKSDVIR